MKTNILKYSVMSLILMLGATSGTLYGKFVSENFQFKNDSNTDITVKLSFEGETHWPLINKCTLCPETWQIAKGRCRVLKLKGRIPTKIEVITQAGITTSKKWDQVWPGHAIYTQITSPHLPFPVGKIKLSGYGETLPSCN